MWGRPMQLKISLSVSTLRKALHLCIIDAVEESLDLTREIYCSLNFSSVSNLIPKNSKSVITSMGSLFITNFISDGLDIGFSLG